MFWQKCHKHFDIWAENSIKIIIEIPQNNNQIINHSCFIVQLSLLEEGGQIRGSLGVVSGFDVVLNVFNVSKTQLAFSSGKRFLSQMSTFLGKL